jgi:thioredoxin-like negative regulator of GroEL
MEHLESIIDCLLFSKEVMVMFYVDWCPFCQSFKPIFESVIRAYTFYESKINDYDNPLRDRFVISAVPTLLAIDNGKIISRRDAKTGVGLSQSDLDSMLNEIQESES